MSKAKVLYIHLTGVSSEILKNLVLAGIKAVVCDNRAVSTNTPSIFLPSSDDKNKKLKYSSVAAAAKTPIEELNPLLGECEIVDQSIDQVIADEDFLKGFCVVVASRLSLSQAKRLATACAKTGGAFYMVDTFGMDGASAVDLGEEHKYRPEKGKELLDERKLDDYVPLETVLSTKLSEATNRFYKTPPKTWIKYRCLLEFAEKTGAWPVDAQDFAAKTKEYLGSQDAADLLTDAEIESLGKTAVHEVAPVCSVLGGMIGNEVIKAISGKGSPANNTMLFDGEKAFSLLIKPKA